MAEDRFLEPERIAVDTTPVLKKVSDTLARHEVSALVLLALAVVTAVLPEQVNLFLFAGVLFGFWGAFRPGPLPFKLPAFTGRRDPHELMPGDKKPPRAKGIFFAGNERNTGHELWFSADDASTHALVLGTTGAGKTVLLTSWVSNALIWGTGFIYVDGKADNSLWSRLYSMCRIFGREDDIRLINYMTGARDIRRRETKRMSNDMNPFVYGSSSMLAQLIIGMMDDAGKGDNADMWKGRSIGFVEALTPILVYLRDTQNVPLSVSTYREYFELHRLERLVFESPDVYGIPHDEWEPVVRPMIAFLESLAGYKPPNERGGIQERHGEQTYNQFGFVTMQLTRVSGSLSDTYGHILDTLIGEVDLYDVAMNGRILIVLLPALEKSPPELANLGKLIVSVLRTAMSPALGAEVEGTYREIISRKPTNTETPMPIVLDEYGYYSVKGFAIFAAQARSLKAMLLFGAQDYASLKQSSPEEGEKTYANTNIKVIGKIEDPEETWRRVKGTASEGYVGLSQEMERRDTAAVTSFHAASRLRYERQDRIQYLDLVRQRRGEVHIIYGGAIVRANTFYAAVPEIRDDDSPYRLNQFMLVMPPKEEDIAELLPDRDGMGRDVAGLEEIRAMLDAVSIAGVDAEKPDWLLLQEKEIGGRDYAVPVEGMATVAWGLRNREMLSSILEGPVAGDDSAEDPARDEMLRRIDEVYGEIPEEEAGVLGELGGGGLLGRAEDGDDDDILGRLSEVLGGDDEGEGGDAAGDEAVDLEIRASVLDGYPQVSPPAVGREEVEEALNEVLAAIGAEPEDGGETGEPEDV